MRSYVIVGIAWALASVPAVAGGKGGNQSQESRSQSNTHVEQTYKQQAATTPKPKPTGGGTITHRKAGKTQQ